MAAATVAWKNGAPSSAPFAGSVLTMMIMSLLGIGLLLRFCELTQVSRDYIG
jgi:hypothetical protein